MAFDGLFLSALVSEFKDTILGGKISKIVQSEKDELQLTIKKERQQYLLHLSVKIRLHRLPRQAFVWH